MSISFGGRGEQRLPMQVMVVIPTYNECENMEKIAEAVLSQPVDVHVAIVDDNSPDGTGEIADALSVRNERVHVIHRQGKMGLGSAYITGFKYALQQGAQYVFEMDADFSHDPAYIPSLLEAARATDVVVGSRYVSGGGTENWGLVRQLISRGGSLYARVILGMPIWDLTGGFNCWRRDVLEAVDLDAVTSNGYAFQIEMKYRAFRRGFRLVEVPIVFVDRRVGESKMSGSIVREALWKVWRFRLDSRIGK
ncbi:MAG: polyprenol monophosphomannose synthase [Chloroflexota bacterium]